MIYPLLEDSLAVLKAELKLHYTSQEFRKSRQGSGEIVKNSSSQTKPKSFKNYFLWSQRFMGNVVLNVSGPPLSTLGRGPGSSVCASAYPAPPSVHPLRLSWAESRRLRVVVGGKAATGGISSGRNDTYSRTQAAEPSQFFTFSREQ